ncbi:M3 family oligoendopeptidase [Brevibacillus fluminis]|uniref:M3 family oligoendopeptidase n=1 Tax=Brevibacillus fluminis TaxID=511487 RepID=UPI003F892367
MQAHYNPVWNMDSVFPGGSESAEFAAFLTQLEKNIGLLGDQVHKAKEAAEQDLLPVWRELLAAIQNTSAQLREAGAFISCLTAQNVHDENAKLLSGQVKNLSAALGAVINIWEEQLLALSEDAWNKLVEDEAIKPLAFPLNERRRRAKEKLPVEQEILANDLAIDGYHAWQDLYNTVVGRITIPHEVDGKVKQLSVGQADNVMHSPDMSVRQEMFAKWEAAWGKEADLCAHALNHLGGFRLNLYRHRGWDSIMKEPLDINRMSEQTLDAMWSAINESKDKLVQYLNRKAKLLGMTKLGWVDVAAPVGKVTKTVSYDEGAAFIIEQFGRFSPKMADFARKAFEQRWIEAEDRAGKRPGGFCTSFPVSKQSRIFMTYAGNASNVSTLAHELGHAYHQHVMNDLPQMVQGYAMNVAETASTFAEMIVSDAAVKLAESREEKIALLEDKIQQTVAFFMNIQARVIFEKNFYAERKKGLVSKAKLNQLMEDAQKEAFNDALSEYHPHFWASKLHFYITTYPFYNFPYTFGYLFSLSIYARALSEGASFEQKYIDLLRDTARMTVEELAQKHLDVDITKPDFWRAAVKLTVQDVEEFLQLTE